MKKVIELKNISKYFAKVIANKDVSFDLHEGEVLALLGENGAGKSTIMKILYGLYHQDEGKILINGEETRIDSPKDAMKYGISMIQQHFSLVEAHTVTENIILGHVKGNIDVNECTNKIKELSDKYGFNLNPNSIIRDLSVGERQKVEILKALFQNTEILIMDEPTAVLTPQEITNLMKFIKDFVKGGNSVVFISHKLNEVMEVADNIVIMRNGELVGNVKKTETDEKKLANLMVGRELNQTPTKSISHVVENENVLDMTNVTCVDRDGIKVLNNLSLTVRKGEIFGIAGVSGNGQQELCEAISGVRELVDGKITLLNEDIGSLSVYERIKAGIGYVPSNRHRDAMISDMTIAENMFLKSSFENKWLAGKLIDKEKLNSYTNNKIRDFSIKAHGPDAKAGGLSGGNQQKVILAREVDNGSKLIVLDQPTRGLDLGAINHVHKSIVRESKNGKGILLVSTELSEIFGLCDRIGVIYQGELQGIYSPDELTPEKVGLLMAGWKEEVR
ncbi:ABC transporter ATP-binding protein [Mycoplasmatota bacterium]|nr:ABC transporter ATP-binding protein [Mycoplasmatota bacterium]